jgi:hypothetical protein
LVLSIDEKSQKPGKAGSMTHLCTSPAGQELS